MIDKNGILKVFSLVRQAEQCCINKLLAPKDEIERIDQDLRDILSNAIIKIVKFLHDNTELK